MNDEILDGAFERFRELFTAGRNRRLTTQESYELQQLTKELAVMLEGKQRKFEEVERKICSTNG